MTTARVLELIKHLATLARLDAASSERLLGLAWGDPSDEDEVRTDYEHCAPPAPFSYAELRTVPASGAALLAVTIGEGCQVKPGLVQDTLSSLGVAFPPFGGPPGPLPNPPPPSAGGSGAAYKESLDLWSATQSFDCRVPAGRLTVSFVSGVLETIVLDSFDVTVAPELG